MNENTLKKANLLKWKIETLSYIIKKLNDNIKNYPFCNIFKEFMVEIMTDGEIKENPDIKDKIKPLFDDAALAFANNVIAIYTERMNELQSEFDALGATIVPDSVAIERGETAFNRMKIGGVLGYPGIGIKKETELAQNPPLGESALFAQMQIGEKPRLLGAPTNKKESGVYDAFIDFLEAYKKENELINEKANDLTNKATKKECSDYQTKRTLTEQDIVSFSTTMSSPHDDFLLTKDREQLTMMLIERGYGNHKNIFDVVNFILCY